VGVYIYVYILLILFCMLWNCEAAFFTPYTPKIKYLFSEARLVPRQRQRTERCDSLLSGSSSHISCAVIVEIGPLVATAANSQGELGFRTTRLSSVRSEMSWSETRYQNAWDLIGPHVKSSSYCMYRQLRKSRKRSNSVTLRCIDVFTLIFAQYSSRKKLAPVKI
jgi:hypothetical protein